MTLARKASYALAAALLIIPPALAIGTNITGDHGMTASTAEPAGTVEVASGHAAAPTAETLASAATTTLRQLAKDDPEAAIDLVREALLTEPEIIREAISALEKRQADAEQQMRQDALAENAEKLYNSEYQVVLGNPEGKVTLVEFFDYNCGYCRRALGDLIRIMETHPDVRVVLKEFPVLGQQSIEAAKVALAFNMQGGDYMAFHRSLLEGDQRTDLNLALAAAKLAGADMDRLQEDIKSDKIEAAIREVYSLADALGLTGTPAYVVGDEVFLGAVGYDDLIKAVEIASK